MGDLVSARVTFYEVGHERGNLLREVLSGLKKNPKMISPKFLYDQRGSELFDRICETEEYYPTRTEIGILENHRNEICELIGREAILIEYGGGSGRKAGILLDGLRDVATYVSIDVSREALFSSLLTLSRRYSKLDVVGICADFKEPLPLLGGFSRSAGRRVIFFPGSTIGNLDPSDARRLLSISRERVGPNGAILVGVDLQKDPAILERAYNDRHNITAEFNLNLIRRLRSELQVQIEEECFAHRAFYNSERNRIEMHLVSKRSQQIEIGGDRISICEGESIHTENSYKYTLDGFRELAEGAGFSPLGAWTDPKGWFSVHFMETMPEV